MTVAKATDDEFRATWQRLGSPTAVARHFGLSLQKTHLRRRQIEERYGVTLPTINPAGRQAYPTAKIPQEGIRRVLNGYTGTAVVFSDAHFWPGDDSAAYRALLRLIKELKPDIIVANGDVFDGARISRHDPIGWEKRPSVREELDACRERMDAIRTARRSATHVWNWGNHCIRFARYLAMNAGDMDGVAGMELTDHIQHWEAGWSLLINNTCMVKHRYRGGIHAARNNTLNGGLTMVTGHLHQLKVTPMSDYRGRRWGVDTGTLANADHTTPQWNYSEDDPKDWCSGFAVLTFDKTGMLIPPELVEVINGRAYFRGGVVT